MGAGASGLGGGDARLLDQIFNLRFTSKQLVKQSARAEKEEKAEKLKVGNGRDEGMGRVSRARQAGRGASSLGRHVEQRARAVLRLAGGGGRRRARRPTNPSLSSLPPLSQVKKAIEKGNIEGAKIYAQNAIRKKGEALNYLRLASRLDAVVSRLDTQAKMQGVTKSMAGIVKSLDRALAANNLDKARGGERGAGWKRTTKQNKRAADLDTPHTPTHTPHPPLSIGR